MIVLTGSPSTVHFQILMSSDTLKQSTGWSVLHMEGGYDLPVALIGRVPCNSRHDVLVLVPFLSFDFESHLGCLF